MFYSHEVLTSRKHGVATVWLVATLGSKSTLKKVDRKEICAVNIPKACQTILSPEAPMALRLQSNLLYGVTRVYGEQCNFVLKDAQAEQNKIRALLRALHTAPTELESKHKAKPDQLILEDDPNFIPEIAWGLDFDPFRTDLDFTSNEGSSQRSSLLSPHAAISSGLGSEHLDPNQDAHIIIPPSASSYSAGGGAGFGLGGGSVISDEQHRGLSRSLYGAQEEGLLDDPGFAFDAEGYLLDDGAAPPTEEGGERAASVHTPMPSIRDDALPDTNDNRDVIMYDDEALPPVTHDDVDMQDVEAFPARNAQQTADQVIQPADAEQETSSTTASAPQRRTRVPKPLPTDQELELHNSDLSAWDTSYLTLMARQTHQKAQYRSQNLARKNAEFWVLRNGVGGLGQVFGNDEQSMPSPLKMFSGTALIEALTGVKLHVAGEKHAREEEEEQEAESSARRVRARSEEAEIGRAIDMDDAAMYDTGFQDQTIEQGREAPTPLADHHSSAHQLPWNLLASTRASSQAAQPFIPNSPHHPASSSINGLGGFNIASSRHRTVSASPLRNRGTLPNDMDALQLLHSEGNISNIFDNNVGRVEEQQQKSDYEIFGPAALVTTQTAATSQWLSNTLNSESLNFLSFVKTGIDEKINLQPSNTEGGEESIEFEVLLDPERNTRIVAAQGLLHVLTLATKNLLRVTQREAFGGIALSVI